MQRSANLIVGIDPGTTASYSLLGLDGGIIEIFSKKNISQPDMISRIIKKGRPLVIATDVSPAPSNVEKLVAKLGAKLIEPDKDISIKEKESLTKEHDPKNDHQRDSLAAALYAYKILSPLIEKTVRFLKKQEKSNLKQDILNLVIGSDIPIKTAVQLAESSKESETKIIKKAYKEKQPSEKDFLKLYKKLKTLKRDNALLKQQNRKLQQQNRKLSKRSDALEKKQYSIPSITSARFKDKTISSLNSRLQSSEQQAQNLFHEINSLNRFISYIDDNIVLKRLADLGTTEFNKKKKKLNIKASDILLIDDLDSFSQKVIDEIKEDITTIVYKKAGRATLKRLPFITIDAKNLTLTETKNYALASKKALEKEMSGLNILSEVIGEYRKQRST
ncbi:DUF460 domain-containing protein [Candidatus Woesearchaeota archaeon]|nr:DUF460 domain-containing protein [Candidatus Woesearchaeota archaeon]